MINPVLPRFIPNYTISRRILPEDTCKQPEINSFTAMLDKDREDFDTRRATQIVNNARRFLDLDLNTPDNEILKIFSELLRVQQAKRLGLPQTATWDEVNDAKSKSPVY